MSIYLITSIQLINPNSYYEFIRDGDDDDDDDDDDCDDYNDNDDNDDDDKDDHDLLNSFIVKLDHYAGNKGHKTSAHDEKTFKALKVLFINLWLIFNNFLAFILLWPLIARHRPESIKLF